MIIQELSLAFGSITFGQNLYLKSLLDKYKPGSVARLLYRATRDGFTDFHSRCDNQGPTVTLFRTDDGRLCGGFASTSWDSSGSFKHDSNAFLFNLDK